MSRFPIPDSALDDRLAIVGTAGSGKTYLTLGAIEHLLARRSRVIGIDPLGVMWGLRLLADGKTPSPYQPVIFGGAHGDLPINEHAGALIGEAVATSRDSCIIDLSQLGTKAAERRFMLAFLTALYRHTDKEPVHLVVDEADMFAPQKLLDKDGDAAKLLGMMETIVRRGRVKGFIPWLLTQRPAVLSKDVLSQADGIVALKLTAKQDHDAIGGWIEATADKGQWQTIRAALPTKQRGEGVIWIPARNILQEVTFPEKKTFDSSRTPKRGERVQAATLKPIDLGALKERLASVETEAKANDPKTLKNEVARLTRELAAKQRTPGESVPKNEAAALKDRERAFQAGERQGYETGYGRGWQSGERSGFSSGVAAALGVIRAALPDVASVAYVPGPAPKRIPALAQTGVASVGSVLPAPVQSVGSRAPAPVQRAPIEGLTAPQSRVMQSVGFWKGIGHDAPTREQVAAVAGYSPSSGGFNNLIGSLKTAGQLEIPQPGRVALANGVPHDAMTPDEARTKMRSVLSSPQLKLLDAALAEADAISRDDLGAATGYSPSSGGFNNLIGSLSTLGIFTKPAPGYVAVSDWAREVLQ